MEVAKSIQITAYFIYSYQVVDWALALVIAPVWPLLYAFFTFSVVVFCNFCIKILKLLCRKKFEIKDCKKNSFFNPP